MGRPKTPGGRRVPVSFKLTEAEETDANALRGDTVLNVFMRRMALERIGQLRNSRIPRTRRPEVRPAAVPPAEPEPARKPAATPQAGKCNHPGKRVNGGWCTACQHDVLPGGRWRE
jgi:hypothetical protein